MATFRRSEQAGSGQSPARNGSRRGARIRNSETLHKPHGVIHPRVQKVGPEHFGIVAAIVPRPVRSGRSPTSPATF